jgi:hypothetical protein
VGLAVVLEDQEAGRLEVDRVVPVVVRVVPDLVERRALVDPSAPDQLQYLVYLEVDRKYSATVEEGGPKAFSLPGVDHEPSKHS